MTRSWLLAWFALGLVFLPAAGMSLCDYRSPRTDLSELDLGFSYRYHRDPYGLESRNINRGRFSIDYVRLFDVPEYGFDIAFQNDLSVVVHGDSEYTLRADGNYKRYFREEVDSFGFAGAHLRSTSDSQSIGLSLAVGVGTGRFGDVTPMAKALRINETLVRRGSLVRDLHPVDLQSLAENIGSAAAYESQAAMLADIQLTLERSGNVRLQGLDALDLFEITQIVQSTRLSRHCGWDLKVGIGYELLSPLGGLNDVLLTGTFNYALASTPREQALLTGSFVGSLDIEDRHRINVSGSYEYIIFDFLTTKASYGFSRETWAGKPHDTHRVSLDFVLSPLEIANVTASLVMESRPYYLNWSVDVQLSIQMTLL